ncbi:hypothetical protein CDAR_4461 [Caerostris darwini]|uniref:Uncharacterized protein n=1 Tax=Caerostris darwini TaxID=1538125 RepID=A0AAV4SKW0_9ARAC|nr:hypothetical protein CDAR_4461 [Caerostris darwini]
MPPKVLWDIFSQKPPQLQEHLKGDENVGSLSVGKILVCCSIQNGMSSPFIKFRKNMFGIWDDKQLHINITFYRFYIYGRIYAAIQLYRRKFPSIPKRGSTACKILRRGCFTSEGDALWAPLSREGGSSEETGCISKDKLPGCRV